MGAACSSPEDMAEEKYLEREKDQRLMDALNTHHEKHKSTVRILLLGAGECGKSTILKQMKILHKGGFTKEERDEQIGIIRSNTIDSMKQLILGCLDLQLAIEEKWEAFADDFLKIDNDRMLSLYERDMVISIWENSETIRAAVARRSDFYLLDSFRYFLDRVRVIFKPDYKPTNQDILQSRVATKGIVETKFVIADVPFVMYDVGGQRGQRKKWIHCFEGCRAIMFVASLSEYDQVLIEDPNKNRMIDSLTLFEGILSLVWFSFTPVILFLNKNDVFQEKIKVSELGRIFGDYHGGFDAKAGESPKILRVDFPSD
ncbi:hypothetical protein AAMO2058_001743900 [Amorphochlora amoebiformis]